jgi:hypothetical protein
MSASDEQGTTAEPVTQTQAVDADHVPPALKRYKFLANKLQQSTSVNDQNQQSDLTHQINLQLDQYLLEIRSAQAVKDALSFWMCRENCYKLLAPFALNLLAAPASQAYVERVFSVCGWLTSRRRNRLSKNLELRAFLIMNKAL